MMTKQPSLFLVLVFTLTTAMASAVNAAERLQIMVSIPPQVYVVQQLGGELVEVSSMLPKGGLPHNYEPKPQQMKALSDADMYLRIMVEFEDVWWEKMEAANPDMYVLDSTKGIEYLDGHAHEEEEDVEKDEGKHHEDEGEGHEHHGRDPHIWLSPRLMRLQVENIYQGLVAFDPEHKNSYSANKEAFMSTLDSLDSEIQAQFSNLQTRKFMIFHPAWSYFARDYDLEQIPVEIEGKEPSAREMMDLMKLAKSEHVRVIFVQPQTSRRSVETIAKQIGARVEVLDPLAADWLENLRRVARLLADALS